jgi:hypothetical protein
MDCLWWKTSSSQAGNFFLSSGQLEKLILDKNNIRKSVSYDVMKLNKQSVRENSKKEYVQQKRTHYSLVSDFFMISLWYLMRIMQKWASKTKNPY